MKEFIKAYDQIIFETKFKNKKWISSGSLKDVEIFENDVHLKTRLKTRYSKDLSDWIYWTVVKSQIINYFVENNFWSKCSKKNPYQKGFTIHLTISNMWLSGTIQNDIEDGEKRIYFSTFLPESPIVRQT